MRLPDELIRQITINCAERGLLLLRVRDELRMTVAAYQVSRIAFVVLSRSQPCTTPNELLHLLESVSRWLS